MPFKGLANKLKTKTGAEATTAPVAAPAPAKAPLPAKPAPTPKKTGVFGGLAATLKSPPPAPAPVVAAKPTLPAPVQPTYGPPKPGAFGNTSSLLSQPYAPKQPDLTFGSSNSTLQIPTVQQQTVVNKAVDKVVDTVDNYQKKPGAGPAAVRTVVDTVKNFDDAVMATGQTKDPVTGEEKSTVRQAIDYGRAGIAGVGLLPPFLAFNAAGQAAENLQPEKPKGAEWLNPAKVSTFVGKKTVKGAATGINKAFGAVTKFGGAGVNAAQEGYFDAYNTITKGLDRSGEGDSKPSEAALAFGNEFGGLAALVIAGKIASEGVGAVKNAKMRTVGTNEVVRSAKQVLAIEKSTNVLGQEKRVAPETVKTNYRKLAQEVHPDKGGTAQQFQVVNQAKLILEDYNTLSGKQFRAKYQAPLVEVNKVIKQLPEKTGQAPQAPVAAKPAFQGLADQVKGKGLATTPSAPPVKAPGAPYVIPPGMKVVSVDVVPTPEQTTAFQEAGFNAFKTPEIPGPVMFEGAAPTPVPVQAPAIPAPVSAAPAAPVVGRNVAKAQADIAEARQLMETAPEASTDPDVKTKADYQRYIDEADTFVEKRAPQPAPAAPKAPAPAPVSRYNEIVKAQRAKLKERTEQARKVEDSHFRYQRLDQLAKQSKAEGFELAAIRRGIEGVPTTKELQNAMKTLESNHSGKSIMIDGQAAKATGKVSFGRHQVELADGTTKYVESAKIESAPVTNEMALAYIKENATRRLEEFAKHYDVGTTPKKTLPAPKAETKKVTVNTEAPKLTSQKPEVAVVSQVDRLKEYIGDIFTIQEPVGSLWKSNGNTLYITLNKDRMGFASWLRQQNFIESAQEDGNNVYKVTLKENQSKVTQKPSSSLPKPKEVSVETPVTTGEFQKKALTPEKTPTHNMFEKAFKMQVDQQYEKKIRSIEAVKKEMLTLEDLEPQYKALPKNRDQWTAAQRELASRYRLYKDSVAKNKEFYNYWTGPSLADPSIPRVEALKTPSENAKTNYRAEYIKDVKKLISSGHNVPAEMIAQFPEFKSAVNARARYEKGYNTSFANKSTAVDYSTQKDYGFKIKNQDGTPISEANIKTITQAAHELEKAIGPIKDIVAASDLTVAHTQGKYPFLTSDRSGQYHSGNKTITVGMQGIHAFAHEMAHFIDHVAGTSAVQVKKGRTLGGAYNPELMMKARSLMNGSDYQIEKATKTTGRAMTELEKANARRLKAQIGYYKSPNEVFARLVEQLVAEKLGTRLVGSGSEIANGVSSYRESPAYWSKEHFAELRELVEAEIQDKITQARTSTGTTPESFGEVYQYENGKPTEIVPSPETMEVAQKPKEVSSLPEKKAPVAEAPKPEPVKAEPKPEAKPQPAPKPVEGGEVAKSKVGKSIEAKTVEKGLADAFSETAGYSKLTIKDQAEKVTDLINNDFQKARDIINGKAEVPDGIYGEYLIKAMEDYALLNGDAELALEVANSALTSATSRLAQGMRLLAERNPDSPVARLQELKKIKEEVAVKRRGKTKEKVVEEMKEAVKKTKTRHTKERWADFITEITC